MNYDNEFKQEALKLSDEIGDSFARGAPPIRV